jgi:hypothetical protein
LVSAKLVTPELVQLSMFNISLSENLKRQNNQPAWILTLFAVTMEIATNGYAYLFRTIATLEIMKPNLI